MNKEDVIIKQCSGFYKVTMNYEVESKAQRNLLVERALELLQEFSTDTFVKTTDTGISVSLAYMKTEATLANLEAVSKIVNNVILQIVRYTDIITMTHSLSEDMRGMNKENQPKEKRFKNHSKTDFSCNDCPYKDGSILKTYSKW